MPCVDHRHSRSCGGALLITVVREVNLGTIQLPYGPSKHSAEHFDVRTSLMRVLIPRAHADMSTYPLGPT